MTLESPFSLKQLFFLLLVLICFSTLQEDALSYLVLDLCFQPVDFVILLPLVEWIFIMYSVTYWTKEASCYLFTWQWTKKYMNHLTVEMRIHTKIKFKNLFYSIILQYFLVTQIKERKILATRSTQIIRGLIKIGCQWLSSSIATTLRFGCDDNVWRFIPTINHLSSSPT